MKNLISSIDSSLLSREQMKKILGGSRAGGISTACTGCDESSCGGGCTGSNGNDGTCGWTAVPTGRCTCAHT